MLFELEPTDENILETILEDLIDRNKDISYFINLLGSVDGIKSIAIDGAWGSGKTFFIKQCKMVLDSMNPFCNMPVLFSEEDSQEEAIKEEHLRAMIKAKVKRLDDIDLAKSCYSVYYDAWDNDNEEDPLVSLIYSIACDVSETYTFSDDPDLRETATSLIQMALGIDAGNMLSSLKGEDYFSQIKRNKNIRTKVNDFFSSLTAERGNKVIVFIDELDRCNPAFAIKTLERIKHYLCHENVIFVFSLNLSQLEHTIKNYYGSEYNSGRYLDRFFDLRLTLPPAKLDNYYVKIGLKNSQLIYEEACLGIARFFNMELRELAKYCRATKIAAYNPTHSSKSYLGADEQAYWIELIVFIPFIIALSRTNNGEYESFINGNGYGKLVDCINSIDFLPKWILTKCGIEMTEVADLDTEIKKAIQSIYNAIFVKQYENEYRTEVFGLEFTRRDKERILRISSCLWESANYE